MSKIYWYELRRTILNKFYFCILILEIFYAKQILDCKVILGIHHTAPFSVTSFRFYVNQIIPLAVIALLSMIRLLYVKNARQFAVLTKATCIDQKMYLFIKGAAIITAWFLLNIVILLMGVIYLNTIFTGDVNILRLFAAGFLQYIPAMCITAAVGILIGQLYVTFLSPRNL